jgi:hypothetical protein
MTLERKFWLFWIAGLVIFALARIPHAPLAIDAVPEGILDHQAAGSAAVVDQIQAAWRFAGLRSTAIFAMCHDLVFIGVYGMGSYWGGRLFMADPTRPRLAFLGKIIMQAAIVFLVTDYVETGLQLMQLLRDSGVDWMAATAAFAQPIKIASWIITFVGIVSALIMRRFVKQSD